MSIRVSVMMAAVASSLALSACQAPSTSNPSPSTPKPTTPSVQPTHTTLPDVVCADGSQTIAIQNGSITQKGTVKGYNYCEYQVQLKAGQRLDVDFSSPSLQANAIVYDDSSIDLSETYTASINQVLPVRVLLTRNEARSGNAHPYTIKFTVR